MLLNGLVKLAILAWSKFSSIVVGLLPGVMLGGDMVAHTTMVAESIGSVGPYNNVGAIVVLII